MVSPKFFYHNSFSRFGDILKKGRKNPLFSSTIIILDPTMYGKVKKKSTQYNYISGDVSGAYTSLFINTISIIHETYLVV